MHPKKVFALVYGFVMLGVLTVGLYGCELFLRWVFDKEAIFVPIMKIIFTGSPE